MDEEVGAIASFLAELSCCSRCIVRFLGIQISENEFAYRNPKEYLDKLVPPSTKNVSTEGTLDEPFSKKIKPNSCCVCLDCFAPKAVEKLLKSFNIDNIKDYKYSNFFFNVSFPKCLTIRAHSMLLHLKKHFTDFSFGNLIDKKIDDSKKSFLLEQQHKIFRIVATDILSKVLDKPYHPKSNLSLLITIGYENDDTEVVNMRNIIKGNHLKKSHVEISRNNLSEYLRDIGDNRFRENFPVPPEIPDKEIFLEKVDITADPVYLGGRYLKFKRNVGQTPWVIDGVSVSEHNVQDILFDAICSVLSCNKNEMTFTASGREDVDVRMLGTGRPFYIKIDNPKQRNFTAEQLHEIQNQIIKSELAAGINLQTVYASDLCRIKFGEEHKKKTYRALCKTTAPDINEAIALINKQESDLKITQLTVMRVLHRRTLMPRDKVIHKMSAVAVPGYEDLFEMEVVTQAGTYVKEFVHSDFGRTRPSVTSIIGHPTDLIALDCVDIALVWPEEESNHPLVSKKQIRSDLEFK